jgi:hypothetical protein
MIQNAPPSFPFSHNNIEAVSARRVLGSFPDMATLLTSPQLFLKRFTAALESL